MPKIVFIKAYVLNSDSVFFKSIFKCVLIYDSDAAILIAEAPAPEECQYKLLKRNVFIFFTWHTAHKLLMILILILKASVSIVKKNVVVFLILRQQ